jgi:hypothetical protein
MRERLSVDEGESKRCAGVVDVLIDDGFFDKERVEVVVAVVVVVAVMLWFFFHDTHSPVCDFPRG